MAWTISSTVICLPATVGATAAAVGAGDGMFCTLAAALSICICLPFMYPLDLMGVLDAEMRRWWPPLSVPSFANADIAPSS